RLCDLGLQDRPVRFRRVARGKPICAGDRLSTFAAGRECRAQPDERLAMGRIDPERLAPLAEAFGLVAARFGNAGERDGAIFVLRPLANEGCGPVRRLAEVPGIDQSTDAA